MVNGKYLLVVALLVLLFTPRGIGGSHLTIIHSVLFSGDDCENETGAVAGATCIDDDGSGLWHCPDPGPCGEVTAWVHNAGHWKTFEIPARDWMDAGPECGNPNEIRLGAAGAPLGIIGYCPMGGGAGLNGYYHFNLKVPAGCDPTVGLPVAGISFEIAAVAAIDPVSIESTRGLINTQCVGNGEVPSTTWTAWRRWKAEWLATDDQWAQKYDSTLGLVPDGNCPTTGNFTIYGRIVTCDDTDSTITDPDCSDSDPFSWPITRLLGMSVKIWCSPDDYILGE